MPGTSRDDFQNIGSPNATTDMETSFVTKAQLKEALDEGNYQIKVFENINIKITHLIFIVKLIYKPSFNFSRFNYQDRC